MVINRRAPRGWLSPGRTVYHNPALSGQTLLDLLRWTEGHYGAHQAPVTCRPEELGPVGGPSWLPQEKNCP